jgi:multiple sugar transport system ATP-binding protein
VVFGVRPEDINDRRLSSSASADCMARATVEVVEPMGAETYLYLKTSRHNFIARVGSRESASVNDQIEMVFDMNKCHFFDAKTERTIV